MSNENSVLVDSNGATISVLKQMGGGFTTFNINNAGQAVLSGTGTSYLEANVLKARNLTNTRVVFADADRKLVDTSTFTFNALGDQLYAKNAVSEIITATSNLYVSGSEASSTTTARAGALQVKGGVGIEGGLYVDQNAFINADLYVQGTLYVQGNSLDGVDTITGSTGTFIDVSSTGTIYANVIQSTGVANFNDIKVTGSGTFTNAITVGITTASQVVTALYSNDIVLASYTSPVISGTAKVYLDTYLASQYRTSNYLVQVIDGGSVYVTELSMFWIGSGVYLSEYGINTNNGALGTFDASKLITGEVELTFTPNGATAMTIKVVRLGITA
jgi:hypothetical protein